MATPVDIRFLARLLPWIIVAGVLGAIIAFAASYLVQPVYRASVLLIPSEADSSLLGGGGGGGLLGAQSVASLVGLGGKSDNVDKGLAILRSRSFCEEVLEPAARRSLIEAERRARIRFAGGGTAPASTEVLCTFLARSVLALAVDSRTRFVTLSIRMTDRDAAAEWANHLAAMINEKMRQAEIDNATTTLEYLSKELGAAASVELRGAIARAMEAQVRVKAFAATRPSYVFSVVDRATAPDEGRFESPRRLVMALGGAVLAGFITLLVLLTRRRS